ncbi:MAG: methyltransferase domain-containing protein, partial [Bacteroidales bacterium]
MNKTLLMERFRKAATSYETEAVTQREIADKLWSMTDSVIDHSSCDSILEIGCGTGFLTRNYIEALGKEVVLNDIYDISENFRAPAKARFMIGDAEQLEWSNTFDLILSASSIQWFNDLDAFFAKCETALNPGGTISLSTFGPKNFIEIREAGGKCLHYPDLQEITERFKTHFELICVKEATITTLFPDVRSILRHIRDTGVMGGLGTSTSLQEVLAFENRFRS